ncbi:MAG: hypothetical protein HQ542_01200 [Bacteroidia bacterium]|nr:hypothetical protein [Bacteroidia bacterium]
MRTRRIGSKTIATGFFLGMFFLSLFLSFQIHHDRGFFNWKSELWADRSGYYIYLPATFLYGFDISKAPEKIHEKTGNGFRIDEIKGKIRTKYPYGLAVLLSPFFCATHLVSLVLNIPEEGGFSPLYHRMINVAAVIYLILALMLLRKVLQRYFSPLVQYLTLFFIYVGTNLYYYTVDDGSMSHIYSFFLFSLFLFALIRFLDARKYGYYLLMVLAGSLAIVTRPTNVLLFSLFFLWDLSSYRTFLDRLKWFLKPAYLITFLLVLFLALLPQLLYWKYLHGTYVAYTYGEEGFTSWQNPYLLEVWFSPLNGLFSYSPLVLLMLAGTGLMIAKRQLNGWIALCLFLLVSYICAAWQTWYFGCSFGQRSFVEYYAILSIPLGFLIQWTMERKGYLMKGIVLFLLIFFSWFNLRLTYAYEKCFFGAAWDWDNYHRQLERAGIPFPGSSVISYMNDFENQALNGGTAISREVVRSGIWSATFDEYHDFCCREEKVLWDFHQDHLPEMVKVSGWAFYPDSVSQGINLVFSAEREGQPMKWEGIELSTLMNGADSWQQFSASYTIPTGLSGDTRLLFYIWNPEKRPIFVDDLVIWYE